MVDCLYDSQDDGSSSSFSVWLISLVLEVGVWKRNNAGTGFSSSFY